MKHIWFYKEGTYETIVCDNCKRVRKFPPYRDIFFAKDKDWLSPCFIKDQDNEDSRR